MPKYLENTVKNYKIRAVTTSTNVLFDHQIKYNAHRAITAVMSFGSDRHYDPMIGGWLEADPIGFADGTNLYQYAKNDPINYIDPNGKFAIPLIAIPLIDIVLGTTIAIDIALIADELINWYNSRNLPPTGPPGGSLVIPGEKGGKHQERFYDDLGNPIKDIDWGHPEHGHGTPHVHDWIDGIRSKNPRPPKPGECP